MTWKAIDDSEGLFHYGVLGMKWGVRHDREKALGKGLQKIHSNQEKSQRYRDKAAVLQARASRGLGARNAQKRAAKLERKSAKMEYKSAKAQARGNFQKGMELHAQAMNYNWKAKKLEKRIAGRTARAEKLTMKAAKLDVQTRKLGDIAVKNYSKREVSSFSGDQVSLGKAYVLQRMEYEK